MITTKHGIIYESEDEKPEVPVVGEAVLGEHGLPKNTTMARSLVESGFSAIRSGFKKVSSEEQLRRHSICKAECEFYRASDDRCSKCGCFTTYKSFLEAWHCPIDKW